MVESAKYALPVYITNQPHLVFSALKKWKGYHFYRDWDRNQILVIRRLEKAKRRASKNGRYEYIRYLGEGAFGYVLQARDNENFGELVAVKFVKGDNIFARLREGKRGAEIMCRLYHAQKCRGNYRPL